MIWFNSFDEINIQFTIIFTIDGPTITQSTKLQYESHNYGTSIAFDFLKAIKVHDEIFSFPRNENFGDNKDDSSK